MTVIKWTLKIIGGLLTIMFLVVLSYYCFYKWRQTRKYDDKITVTAYYMQYACGDCSADMKVITVDNSNYNFIIEHDIFPTPQTKKFDDLCNYIGDVTYKQMKSSPNATAKAFELVGHLHKNPHDFPIFDCSDTPYFTVDKIKYGGNGKWTNF